MRSCGCIKSILNGSELNAANCGTAIHLPSRYELSMPSVRDQGMVPKCVSVSLTDMIAWKFKLYGKKVKFPDSIFYDKDPNATRDGMQPKTAFEILVHSGSDLIGESYSIYAMVTSIEVAKRCIIQHGPVMVALPVKSYENDFWNGYQNLGGHAVLLTGYNKDGFTLRNSWGSTYGNGGYWELPYDDFYKVFEAWTLIS